MAAQSHLDYGPDTREQVGWHTEPPLNVVTRAAPPGYQRVSSPPGPSYLETQRFGIVDRADDLAAIRSLLLASEVRLLTLTGPAGVGKTRLALEVGRTLTSHFADGVVFADLSLVRDPSLVVEVLAQGLDSNYVCADGAAPAQIEASLRDRAMLIVLDNAEQVLSGVSRLAELLAAVPQVTLLVTSREALHLRWEQIYRVPPLALPDPQNLPPLEELADIPAVALFLQRAQAIDPDFVFTENTARALAELCVRLDGLPLAIELAAVRTALLSPQMILERLGQRLSLLHWQAHDLPQRQQTLGAAIAWSYELLSPDEQTLFRYLGVFAGSFSLRAAEAIADHLAIDPFESLASLVDKSLVQVQGRDQDDVRYVLLESMREYARERLEEAGELEEAGRSHALFYLALAERAEPELFGSEQHLWFARLEWAHENMRAALRWLLDQDEGELALRLATALGSFWARRGYVAEGSRELNEALTQASTANLPLRAKGLSFLGALLVWTAGEVEGPDRITTVERADALLGDAVALARSLEDPLPLARSLTSLGMLGIQRKEWSQARRVLEEALTCWQEGHHPNGAAHTLLYLGAIELMDGNVQEALRLADESLACSRVLGDESVRAMALLLLMTTNGVRGEGTRTAALVEESLGSTDVAQNPRLLPLCAAGVAWLSRDSGDPERLACLLGAAETRHHVTQYAARILFRMYVAVTNEALQARIRQKAFDAALAKGHSLSLEQMTALIDEALDGTQRFDASTKAGLMSSQTSILSPRESEVLQLVAQGLSDKQIAQEIFVSKSTVHYHMTSIFNKLGVDSRAHAVAVATQRGLLLLDGE